jgi:hypothetical protein
MEFPSIIFINIINNNNNNYDNNTNETDPKNNLLQLFTEFKQENNTDDDTNTPLENEKILNFLIKLPPPAIDLEFRSLCTNENDEDGVLLLRCLLVWLAYQIETGSNFEILQAYLHRILVIYLDLMIKNENIKNEIEYVKNIHEKSSKKFRNIIQKNLCLLKMLANIPIS